MARNDKEVDPSALFRTIWENDVNLLASRVEAWLKVGFVLNGGTTMALDPARNKLAFCQSVAKPECFK
jgi:hypothetical protein